MVPGCDPKSTISLPVHTGDDVDRARVRGGALTVRQAPVLGQIKKEAIDPLAKHSISQTVALQRGQEPLREFMFKQTRTTDLALFVRLTDMKRPKVRGDVPTYVLIPAFIVSELKTAFQMGFLIFLPFLVIDMVVSMILTSVGMVMLPPVLISLPFKLLLFVLIDGWHLLTRVLAVSFR